MSAELVAAEWAKFEAMVMPPNAGPVQRAEMRKAFYAGAHIVLCTLKQISANEVTEEQGFQVLDALEAELQAFADAQAAEASAAFASLFMSGASTAPGAH